MTSFKKFLQEKAEKKGAFHAWLGKKPDEPITAADIAKGKAAGGHAEKMAIQAQNFHPSRYHKEETIPFGKEALEKEIANPERNANDTLKYPSHIEMLKRALRRIKDNEGSGSRIHRIKEENLVSETISKDADTSTYINDFIHSKNKMFKNDSKKQRIKRAIAASYASKK